MMDFTTPPRDRYYDPRPANKHHHPVKTDEPVTSTKTRPASRNIYRPKLSLPISWPKLLAGLLIIGLITWLAHGYISTKNQLENQKNDISGVSSTPTQQLIDKVNQLVDLPGGETPTIATVKDVSKLKNQNFFANAKNGDKVLIFSKAGKAVLYRPSTNKVIEYTTVNLGQGAGQ